jgi:pyruvate formate-lyase activating enzyme-like uncharacterized protein
MIINIDSDNITKIKNTHFYNDAIIHTKIYQKYKFEIEKLGLDFSEYDENLSRRRNELISELKSKGAIFRNNNKSIYINKISNACLECKRGDRSLTLFFSLECNRDCYFCSNKNQENYEIYVKNDKDVIAEYKTLKNKDNLVAIGLTGGEPLIHVDKVCSFFTYVKKERPNIHTRLYTNGDLVDEDILVKLRDSGLDEIRFSIKIEDSDSIINSIIKKLIKAKAYISAVMVEMPVIPGTVNRMKALLDKLELANVDGINLLEFLFPLINPLEYRERGFKIKYRPYEVLYNYTYAGGLPISGSEEDCLEILLYGIEKNFNMGMHYCSLENKLFSQIYNQNINTKLLDYEVFSQKDFFIKTAKVYGNQCLIVLEQMKKLGEKRFYFDKKNNILEFHPILINNLPEGIEVAISYNVIEMLNNRKALKEIKLDLTYPEIFQYESDI